ncbi:hypothetical protein NUACC21_30770 [Scytonema sp. NUACC21]
MIKILSDPSTLHIILLSLNKQIKLLDIIFDSYLFYDLNFLSLSSNHINQRVQELFLNLSIFCTKYYINSKV